MAAGYSSRDLVEDYLRCKLLNHGLPGRCRASAQRGRNSATPSWRGDSAVTSHRQDPSAVPARLRVVLCCAGDELERRCCVSLAEQASVLLQRPERRRSLAAVREELFKDGVNWGRIVAMMELGGALCTKVVQEGEPREADDIASWMEESLETPSLQEWIEDNGGWDAFVELYGEPRPPGPCFWSLRTLLGLAALGAAVITLGALVSQR